MKLTVHAKVARKFPPIFLLRIMARAGYYNTKLEG